MEFLPIDWRTTTNKNILHFGCNSILLWLFWQKLCLYGEYAWIAQEPSKVIIDIGVNSGDTTLYYIRYPEASIIAVEPLLVNFTLLQKNIVGITEIAAAKTAIAGTGSIVRLN